MCKITCFRNFRRPAMLVVGLALGSLMSGGGGSGRQAQRAPLPRSCTGPAALLSKPVIEVMSVVEANRSLSRSVAAENLQTGRSGGAVRTPPTPPPPLLGPRARSMEVAERSLRCDIAEGVLSSGTPSLCNGQRAECRTVARRMPMQPAPPSPLGHCCVAGWDCCWEEGGAQWPTKNFVFLKSTSRFGPL